MQILEVKNDIAKITYNPMDNRLLPSDFLLIEDANQKLIAQIINIETTDKSDEYLAILRLALSIDKEDNLSFFNGYVPSKTSSLIYITPDEIIELIKGSEKNIYLGNLSNHSSCFVKTSMSFVNDRLYIQSDRDDKTKIVVENLISELRNMNKKVILIDFSGQYSMVPDDIKLKISKNIKLPLNIEAFDTILQYDIVDCPIEDKAVIQSIVLELREYMKTLPDKYIPFDMFKNVVDAEFESNPVSGLMLLRNKLWLYAQDGIFANTKEEFDVINSIFFNQNIIVVDASEVEEKWFKFIIETVSNLTNHNCYLFLSLNDIKIDKKSILSLYNKENILPVVSTSYESNYRSILMSLCKNYLLCKPASFIEEQAHYTPLLNRMNNGDFIAYGETTLNLPLIIELQAFDASTPDSVVENEIKKDVDKFLSSPQTVIPKTSGIVSDELDAESLLDDFFAEEDLDSVAEGEIVSENLETFDSDTEDNSQEDIADDFLNEQVNDKTFDETQSDIRDDEFHDSDFDFLDEVSSQNQDDDILNVPFEVSYGNSGDSASNYGVFTPVAEELNENSTFVEKVSGEASDIIEDVEQLNIDDNIDDILSDIPDASDVAIIDDTVSAEIIENISNEIIEDDSESIIPTPKPATKSKSIDDIQDLPDDILLDDSEEIPDLIPADDEIEPIPDLSDDYQTSDMVIWDEDVPASVSSEVEFEVSDEQDLVTIPDDDDSSSVNDENSLIEEITEDSEEILEEELALDEELASLDDLVDDIASKAEMQNDEEEIVIDNIDNSSGNAQVQSQNVQNETELVENTNDVVISEKVEQPAQEEQVAPIPIPVPVVSPPPPPPPVNENISYREEPKTIPVYETDVPKIQSIEDIPFKVGDRVYHPKHGEGVIEAFSSYSNRILFCHILFDNVGRKIMDPRVSCIEKI